LKILLDTHLLLWAVGHSDRLKPEIRQLIEDASNVLYFSAASIWEVSIKTGLGRADFAADPEGLRRELVNGGFLELPVSAAHAVAVLDMPPLHKDPFDRMLIAQARHEGFLLLTADATIAGYGGAVMLA